MLTSYLIQILFYLKLTVNEFKEGIRWTYLKEWLKASPINLYDIVGNRIAAFTLIFLFVYGGELARAYYGAAVAIAGVIGSSSYLAYALYPKLLSEVDVEDVRVALKMVLTFAIPMIVGAMVLSDAYLTILNPAYTMAKPVLSILAIGSLCGVLSQVFSAVVVGSEKVDAEARIRFRQLVKSRLFKVFTLPYIYSAVALPATFFTLVHVAKTPLEAAVYLAFIGLCIDSAMLLCRYVIARRCLPFRFPWKSVGKYVVASGVMATMLSVISLPARLTLTVGLTFLGAIIYFVTLAFIDEETRLLAKSIFKEIHGP